jgi:hypothetical protein
VRSWLEQLRAPGPLALLLPAVTGADDDGVLEVDVEELQRQHRVCRARLAIIDALLGPGEPGRTTTTGQQQWAVQLRAAATHGGQPLLWGERGAEVLDQATALRVAAWLTTPSQPAVVLVTRIVATLYDGTEVTSAWQPVRIQAGEHR